MVRKVDLGSPQEFLQRVVVMAVVVVESLMKHSSRAVAIVMVAIVTEVAGALYLIEASGEMNEVEKDSSAGLGEPKRAEDYIWGVAHRRPQVEYSLEY
jgi:hypothetical protein